jgi:hypothetical protein
VPARKASPLQLSPEHAGETDTALIQRTMETVGRTGTTEITAFTDGCPDLHTMLASIGVTKPPILNWFHIAMRLQLNKLTAAILPTDNPNRVTAKTKIVAEKIMTRLSWCICTGNGRDAQRIKRIRKVMHAFKGEQSPGPKGVRRASAGTRCMRSIHISAAKPHG